MLGIKPNVTSNNNTMKSIRKRKAESQLMPPQQTSCNYKPFSQDNWTVISPLLAASSNLQQGTTKNKLVTTFSNSAQNKSQPFFGLTRTIPGSPSSGKNSGNESDSMDWESTITEETACSLDHRDIITTSADDSVVILDTPSKSSMNRSTDADNSIIVIESIVKKPLGTQSTNNRDTVDSAPVIVISDGEDEASCSLKRYCTRTEAAGTTVSGGNDVKKPEGTIISPKKKKKKKKKKTITPNTTLTPDSSSGSLRKPNASAKTSGTSSKYWTYLCPSDTTPAVKIVSEVINIAAQEYSLPKCTSKTLKECKESDCVIHVVHKKVIPHSNVSDNKNIDNGRKGPELRIRSPNVKNNVPVRHVLPFQRHVSNVRNTLVPSSGSNSSNNLNTRTSPLKQIVHNPLLNQYGITRPILSNPYGITRTATALYAQNQFNRKRRLRPIVVDGSNVAFAHGQKDRKFSCKGIELCVQYFQSRGHEVTVFVPQYRRCKSREIVGGEILERLGDKQIVVFTPSRTVNGVLINSYDDRFILDLAVKTGGIIVSNDNYRDIKGEKPEWTIAVNQRLLMFVFVGDHFMVPDDPLGRRGACLEDFLSFPT